MQQTDSVPHDLNLELALIALILADNTVLDRIQHVERDHFHDLTYREVFEAARDLRAARQRVNLVTLSARMGGDPLGGIASVLDSLRQFSFNGQEPDAYDGDSSLTGLHAARQMQAIGQRLADSVWNYGAKRSEVIEATMRELDALLASERKQKRTSWDMEAGMDDMLRGLDADLSDRFIPTGLRDLDDLTGGMRRGDLVYLGGRPNMGKTAIGISIAINAAKAGHGVSFQSLEMD
jgi:replicative DNA helicase